MPIPETGPHGGAGDAPWSASAGGVMLATAAVLALALDGSTYPCLGAVKCEKIVFFRPLEKWLLLGLLVGGLAFAIGVRFRAWTGRTLAVGVALAGAAAWSALSWTASSYGSATFEPFLPAIVCATAAAALLGHAVARGRAALSWGDETTA